MTTEERLENLERELARAKRRNLWLVAVVGLGVVGLILAWTWNKTTATAQAQAVGGAVPETYQVVAIDSPPPVLQTRQQRPVGAQEFPAVQAAYDAADALELAKMKRKYEETMNTAYLAASQAPEKAAAILEKAKQDVTSIQSSQPDVQQAYELNYQNTIASWEAKFAALAQAVGKTDKAIHPESPSFRAGNYATQEEGGAEKVIRANAFILEDATGKTRAVLSVDKDGPGLGLYDVTGKTRIMLGMLKDGPAIQLLSPEGKVVWVAGGADGIATTPRRATPPVEAALPAPAALPTLQAPQTPQWRPSTFGDAEAAPPTRQWRECPTCAGSGTDSFSCGFCNGTGKDRQGTMCSHCNGRGFGLCPRCKGKGMVND